ncbi:TPA: hypothetical protein QDC51_001015 [Burkholderia multivorans]|uniref:hypothetical protein n=1 Tax=Burkholderia dolosa TaxID=152500 RepID=UPI001B9B4F9F|nr:hypothetical protein [Burkholderia dolosa]HDR9834261.1 hypothetical protein [Burkholderia multivorans]MBR8312402.1 hypothetical protein [Burkholderia dolosa]HDR9840145.1 hypothetical protein [Burkholderia multivorans]HDR9846733.1 hypothetical protein [Burkholderia multivorans]HDR9853143.1 hypothetical protein [Burkholderia multivorans]
MTDGSNRAEQRDSTSFDDVRQARIDELCHRMTMCDTRAVRVWLCHQLKREIKALNDERMARLNEALASAGA